MRTYIHKFTYGGQSWTCAFEVTVTNLFMRWEPKYPLETAPLWREYRHWRDRCLQDFAQRDGVLHEITGDIPWFGVRMRVSRPVTREAAYRFASVHHAELTGARVHEGQRETRAKMLREFGAMMLASTPDGAMQ